MTHDSSSPPKFWWPDTDTSLPCILVPNYWHQFLVPVAAAKLNKFYSTSETWIHVTQMQHCHWPPRFASFVCTPSSANIVVLH